MKAFTYINLDGIVTGNYRVIDQILNIRRTPELLLYFLGQIND